MDDWNHPKLDECLCHPQMESSKIVYVIKWMTRIIQNWMIIAYHEKNHSHMDDYRWPIIIQLWNLTIPVLCSE